jgi:hypothetical protein
MTPDDEELEPDYYAQIHTAIDAELNSRAFTASIYQAVSDAVEDADEDVLSAQAVATSESGELEDDSETVDW